MVPESPALGVRSRPTAAFLQTLSFQYKSVAVQAGGAALLACAPTPGLLRNPNGAVHPSVQGAGVGVLSRLVELQGK